VACIIIIGDISYSYSKECEPHFSNIDELREMDDNLFFATNPTKLVLIPGSVENISLKSGDIMDHNIQGT